jgi:hypothetical protein
MGLGTNEVDKDSPMTLDFLKLRLFGASISDDDRDEKAFLQDAKSALESRESNPDRVECPPSEFLSKLASHQITMEELRTWTQHLSSCGECYREFESLRPKSNPVRTGLKDTLRRLAGKQPRKK